MASGKNDIMSADLDRYKKKKVQDKYKKSTKDEHVKLAKYASADDDKQSLHQVKAKRINMSFSDDVYMHIMTEAERLGVSTSAYVNEMLRLKDTESIENYYNSLLIKPSKNFVPRKRKEKSKRINLTFQPDVHEKILLESEKYNQTITQYVNMILMASI